ncbi:MAG: sulfatase [Myxococcota bacterium]
MALSLILLACARFPAEPVSSEGAACPDDRPQESLPLPRTVLMITTDTVNRDFLGHRHPEWDTTPTLDAIASEGVRFDNVIVPRGLSGPSIATMATGAYPRTHSLRDNTAPDTSDYTIAPYPPDVPTLFSRAKEVGYATWGIWANMCFVMGDVDHRYCTWSHEMADVTQEIGDALLVEDFVAQLSTLPSDAPLFAWVHFMDPHDPYKRRDPWYEQFHPEPYDGPYVEPNEEVLATIADGAEYNDEDRRHVEAVYASQLRATDELAKGLVDALAAAGRWDDAVVFVGFDHGDELARRSTYFYHGCSPYNGAIASSFTLRAPGSIAGGEVLRGWVPSTDVVATLADVVGLGWDGPQEGLSLMEEVRACEEPVRAAFFERGNKTAGVVYGHHKYVSDPDAGYAACKHYDAVNPYPGEPEELYDLEADPVELTNIVESERELADELRDRVCRWVTEKPWVGQGDEGNPLVRGCAE